MATDPSFVEYVADQLQWGERFACKKMFGEYGLYLDGKMIALACDGSLFVKPTAATDALTAGLPRRPPYSGAKPHVVADELLDDAEPLRGLLLATAKAMPAPRAKARKK